ncbi:lymphokine-activated killer T-cell-originated protein kinase [Neodiprion fabricii]|uniref:lymphokine-activated killer T-cell-originated protein kinase n=1 Tax=Neodiprion fabricii TaxID=2872261 RepID=UPI001ED942AB|nr:lymphokine-activated killer T-cell-originated protein kinase [Neodiprion fabricii]
MAHLKTPKMQKFQNKTETESELSTPLKIPASPFLHKIGYGTGVHVFTLERSPKVGFTRSPWAIKKVSGLGKRNPHYSKRIQIEADILRNLNHPNVVGYRGFVTDVDGMPCLAMEQLHLSLGDMIEDMVNDGIAEPFPAANILGISFEVVKGLEYLHHEAHILHGDVKSFNILISKDRAKAKLCDFGVSVPLTDSLEMDVSKAQYDYIGTECWSAPEILQDARIVTNKADMWAFGIVVWEMISLSLPHVESEEDSLDGSYLENPETEPMNVPRSDSFGFCETASRKYGTRPALPAINLGPEYQRVLKLFHACTDSDYKSRPSAKGVVTFFNNYVRIKAEDNYFW